MNSLFLNSYKENKIIFYNNSFEDFNFYQLIINIDDAFKFSKK